MSYKMTLEINGKTGTGVGETKQAALHAAILNRELGLKKMSAYELYKIELEKLRQLAVARDFTPDGELRWVRQLGDTKRAYHKACDESFEESERELAKK